MIRLNKVSKYFDSTLALEDVSLEISTGEQVVIQGPSGGGKSTLLRLIAGLETPTQGEIYLGAQLASSPESIFPPHTRNIGFVFQRSALWQHMTVAQNIHFAMRNLSKSEEGARLSKLLEEMELTSFMSRYPSQLSGGEARRVAIARALAAEPKILLMDEALTSLNPELKEHILALIQKFVRQKEITLLYVTHLTEEAQQIHGRKIYIQKGKIVKNDPQ